MTRRWGCASAMPSAMVEALPMQPTMSRWSGISLAGSGTVARHAPIACSVVTVMASPRCATSRAMASRRRTRLGGGGPDEHHGWSAVLDAVQICARNQGQILWAFDGKVRNAPGIEGGLDEMH